MATNTQLAPGEFKQIPIIAIAFNPNNPRKHTDKAALKDMAESIKKNGVIEPIVVRPGDGKDRYELIVGERRVRAAKLAKSETIPAIVRQMDDRAALEVMIIENDQRKDPAPLDQARGYDLWLKMPDEDGKIGTREDLATRVGASVSWIYARLKLLDLIPAGQEALDTNAITPGHAILIARLQPGDQVRALRASFGYNFYGAPTAFDGDPAKLKLDDLFKGTGGKAEDRSIYPEKALRQWIQDNINLKLKGVPWELDDATLVPEAGACSTCQKRSASNPSLFGELAVKDADTCFDPDCYKGKREVFVQLTINRDQDAARVKKHVESEGGTVEPDSNLPELRQLSERNSRNQVKPDQRVLKQGQWLEAKRGSCPDVEKAMLVDGDHAGETRHVCCNQKCKKHPHHLQAPARPKPAANPEKEKQRQEALEFERKITEAWELELKRILIGKLNGPDRAALILFNALIGDFVMYGQDRGRAKQLRTVRVAQGWDLLAGAVIDFLFEDEGPEHAAIAGFADVNKLDLKKLEQAFRSRKKAELKKAEK